jgi:quercetin dioxygenase-like cupin family protein
MSRGELLKFITKDDVQVEEAPWGVHDWISREGLTDARHLMLVRVAMPAGKAHAFHRHPAMEEIIYVVSGKAEQWVDQEKSILGPGDSAHIPMDMVHGTYNAGTEDLVFLAVLSPAIFDGPALIDVSSDEPWSGLRDG